MKKDPGLRRIKGLKSLRKQSTDDSGQRIAGAGSRHAFIAKRIEHRINAVRDDGPCTLQDDRQSRFPGTGTRCMNRVGKDFVHRQMSEPAHFPRVRGDDSGNATIICFCGCVRYRIGQSFERKKLRVFCQQVQRICIEDDRTFVALKEGRQQLETEGVCSQPRTGSS